MLNRQRKCWKCDVELVNATGVHMGIPFAHTTAYKLMVPKIPFRVIVCGRCYDVITTKDNIQRTGEEVI